MNRASRTTIASAEHIVGIVALVCVAAAASLAALAAAVGSAGAADARWRATTLNASHQIAAGSTGAQAGMYGNPAAAAPFWRLQHSGDCGEMAVADVVGQITGHEPSERQITSLAENTTGVTGDGPIYQRRGGTEIRNLPVLLAHYRIQSSLHQTTIGGLEQDLAQQHKVIAAVNAETLWNDPGNRKVDNHVVVVTGVDTKAGMVHLNDSGIRSGRDEQVSLAAFAAAWATSNNIAVVTT
jgi:hypothetical protein